MFSSIQVHKVLSNIGNVHFEGLLHLLRYIWDNNSLGLRYYSQIEDAPLSELFIHSIIHTDNQLMMFSNCTWYDCPDTYGSTGTYVLFYQGVPIDNIAHVIIPVAPFISEI